MCHMSPVMCPMSHVKKNSCFFIPNKIGQSGGAGRWRVCYRRGLPRLVSVALQIQNMFWGNSSNTDYKVTQCVLPNSRLSLASQSQDFLMTFSTLSHNFVGTLLGLNKK